MLYYNPEQYFRLEFCSFDFNHSVYRLVVTVLMFNDVPLFMAATDKDIATNEIKAKVYTNSTARFNFHR